MACNKADDSQPDPIMSIRIPSQGNSWFFISPDSPSQQVFDFSNDDWVSSGQIIRTYFRVEVTGKIDIGIRTRVEEGTSVLKAMFGAESKDVEVSSKEFKSVYIGSYTIPSPGYYYVDIVGEKKVGRNFAEISDILLGGEATKNGVHYANEEYFYWGRRGPSVHLNYSVPQQASDVVWFYNEVNVPAGNDVIGSYFMANGFAQGYFGFQVNSSSERRVLFSVWSPYDTQNPSEIPAEYRVVLRKKGNDVAINDFGNEGSGGQSYLIYNWKSSNTYKFLLKVEPVLLEDNKTDYTAYFFAPEVGAWQLIASWRRPFTNTYAKSLYSFLENFETQTGPLGRMACYGNQWVYDTNNRWHELTSATFSADNTARDKARLDYSGGIQENQFFLRNCGFFNETTPIDCSLTRIANGVAPNIDFSLLP